MWGIPPAGSFLFALTLCEKPIKTIDETRRNGQNPFPGVSWTAHAGGQAAEDCADGIKALRYPTGIGRRGSNGISQITRGTGDKMCSRRAADSTCGRVSGGGLRKRQTGRTAQATRQRPDRRLKAGAAYPFAKGKILSQRMHQDAQKGAYRDGRIFDAMWWGMRSIDGMAVQ